MNETIELAVIGAGPAGMAAAMTAHEAGLKVTVFDAEHSSGGQIYRNVDNSPLADIQAMGGDYTDGAAMVHAFQASDIRHIVGADVWNMTPEGEIGILSQGQASFVQADRIIIATGAQERPTPYEGWTLPGAMTVGAGQVLIKSSGVVPADGVVLAGLGPLLLLVAWQYQRLGVKVRAVLDMTPIGNFVRAARFLPRAMMAGDYIAKGWRLLSDLKRAGVPIHRRVTGIRVIGADRVEAIEFMVGGLTKRIDSSVVMTHFGLVPETNLTRALRLAHHWDDAQQCWRPTIDEWGQTDQPRIQVAGDGRGIFGAKSAFWSGQLAALEATRAVSKLNQAERDAKAAPIRDKQRVDHRIRPFLEALYAPNMSDCPQIPDNVTVCRCEEVTVGDVRAAAKAGAIGANQVKVLTRAGMGPCQGRQCGFSVARLMANETGRPIGEIELPRSRFPLRPISLGALAASEPPSQDGTT